MQTPVASRSLVTPARRTLLVQLGFLLPGIAYVLLFFAYPLFNNLNMSFRDYTTRSFLTGEAPWIGFNNYQEVIGFQYFERVLWNTFWFTVLSIAGQFTIGLLVALYFRRRFPGNQVLRGMLLVSWLIPLIASTAVWRWMLDKDNGVINLFLDNVTPGSVSPGWLSSTSLALIACVLVNIWIGIPFNAALLYAGLQDIPRDVYEAATVDGASSVQTFRRITWPLLRPTVTVVLVLGVVYTIKVLDIILGLTGGGPAYASQTMATQAYQFSFEQFEFGQGAAMGNLLMLVTLVFALVYLRMNRRSVDD